MKIVWSGNPEEKPRTSCVRKLGQTLAEAPSFRRLRVFPVFAALLALIGVPRADAAPSQPPVATVSFAPSSIQVGETSMMTITLNNTANPNDSIIGVHIVDSYPAGITTSGLPVQSDTCGFAEDVSSPNVAYLSYGTIAAGGSCSIVIQVVGSAPAFADNHTGVITSANAPDGADASAILTIGLDAPTVQNAFDPAVLSIGGTSRMTIKLTNPNPDAITGTRFTDNYPLPLMIANSDVGTIVSNTCGGNLDAPATGTTVALIGGTIPANDSCSVVVNVVGTSAGFSTNHTGAVDSDNAFAGAEGVALAIVNSIPLLNAPDIEETFTPSNVDPGGASQMKISFSNPNAGPILAAQLDDIYPIGMINANSLLDPVVSDTCGFAHDVPRDSGWAKLSGGTIPSSQTCDIVINVVADVMASTTLTNPTGPMVASNAQTSAGATAVLTVDSNVPTITCVLPNEVDIVGDMIDIDLSTLFAPPAGKSLVYDVTNPAPGLTLVGSLLSGTLSTVGTVTTTLMATTAMPGGMSASEDVRFDVLGLDELVFRDGFGSLAPPCQ